MEVHKGRMDEEDKEDISNDIEFIEDKLEKDELNV